MIKYDIFLNYQQKYKEALKLKDQEIDEKASSEQFNFSKVEEACQVLEDNFIVQSPTAIKNKLMFLANIKFLVYTNWQLALIVMALDFVIKILLFFPSAKIDNKEE